ncbi:transport protein Sec61 subunit beta [Spatholobus suberectus]|nr:transport protein Sec61 subunit beta [Spatholobus suberectus]
MRRRRLGGGKSLGSVGGGNSNMLRLYTDDNASELKISLTVVLVMSLCFIAFVTTLHIFNKLYRYKSSVAV